MFECSSNVLQNNTTFFYLVSELHVLIEYNWLLSIDFLKDGPKWYRNIIGVLEAYLGKLNLHLI